MKSEAQQNCLKSQVLILSSMMRLVKKAMLWIVLPPGVMVTIRTHVQAQKGALTVK